MNTHIELFIEIKKMLIGLIGKKSSGKDTFGEYLIQNYSYQKRAFADPLKECCSLLFQIPFEHFNDESLKETMNRKWNKTPRQLLQIVGTDLFRNRFDKNFWLLLFENWFLKQENKNIVCTDVRFQNEADLIKKLGGILIRINRPLLHTDNHESEQLNIQNYDYEIENNSTLENFIIQIKNFCQNNIFK
jgi:hypothetical protein